MTGWNRITADGASAGSTGWQIHRSDGAPALKIATAITADALIDDVVVTLPPCIPNAGRIFVVIRVDDSGTTYAVTVEPDGSSESINGLPTYDGLDTQYATVTLLATSIGVWIILAEGAA